MELLTTDEIDKRYERISGLPVRAWKQAIRDAPPGSLSASEQDARLALFLRMDRKRLSLQKP